MLFRRFAALRRAVALTGLLALVAFPVTAGGLKVAGVVGQPTARTAEPNAMGVNALGLHTPAGLAFDPAGNLYVADVDNNRVLCFRSPFETDYVADLVVGQADFVSNAPGLSATRLNCPTGVATDSAGNLFVADTVNNRVLEFDDPLSTDAIADRVFGQPDFTSATPNAGGPGAASLFYPAGVAVDAAGDLWVADSANSRVLEFDAPVNGGDPTADLVVGQPDFATTTPNTGGPSASSLLGPQHLAIDMNGAMWVTDFGNNRALGYDDPKRYDAVADVVLGQADFDSTLPNGGGDVDARGLNLPAGIAVDAGGDVFVADYGNNRTLRYRAPRANGDRIADRVFGQRTFATAAANRRGVTRASSNHPIGVAVDPEGRVAISDGFNNRVLMLEAHAADETRLVEQMSSA